MTSPIDLAKLLRDALEERCGRNAKYSLRAFARDLGVPAPRLSRWLRGEDGLSRQSATRLAIRLGLSSSETETFVLAMESKYARAKKMREIATEKLKKITDVYTALDVEAFKVISDWYNLATLALVETKDFRPEPKWVAQRLGVSVYEAKGAIQRLKDLEMLEEGRDGRLRPTGVFFANPAGIPSKNIRMFHAQILDKAKMALEFQTVEERDFSTLVLSVDDGELKEAKIFIKKFRDEFERRFCNSNTKKREVYALSSQFFRLSKFKKPGEEK